MMLGMLAISNTRRWHRFTPFPAGALAAVFLTFEAPLSGAKMNPARALGPTLTTGNVARIVDLLRRTHARYARGQPGF